MSETTCYYFQSEKCILHKKCFFCQYKTKKIEGINNTNDYLKFSIDKINSEKSYRLSVIAIFLSLVLTVIKIYDITTP